MSDPLPHLTPVRVLVDAETTWTGRVVGVLEGGAGYIVAVDGWPCEGHPYGCHTVAAERVERV